MTKEDNRRSHERVPVENPVEGSSVTETFDGRLKDISIGGAAIESQGSFEIGIGAPVELRVENFRSVAGHVVRATDGNDFAIAFDESGVEIRQMVDEITDTTEENQ
jgi:hypothetical protein